MSYFISRSAGSRALRVTTMLSGLLLLLLSVLLAGCGGGGSGTVVTPSIYAAKTVSATKMPLGALTADLQVTTAATGNSATSTLTLVDPTRATVAHSNLIAAHSRLIVATPNLSGIYDPKTGAINLTGSYEYPVGTKHTAAVTGTLPVAPGNKGSLTFTIDGKTYGPFVFGDNTPATGTGSTGTTGATGSTSGIPQITGRIVYADTAGGANDIFAVSAAGGTPVNLTNSSAEEESPAISPDGALIAYYRRTGNQADTSQIWVMNADGSNARSISDCAGSALPSWSPDGAQLVFEARGGGLVITNKDGSQPRQLVPVGYLPTWNPTDNTIAFNNNLYDAAKGVDIINTDGTGRRPLLTNGRDVDFSPDGKKIAYEQQAQNGATGVFIANADGSAPVQVTNDGYSVDFSLDGKSVCFASRRAGGSGSEGGSDIYIQTADGIGTATRLTTSGGALGPHWR